MRDFRDTGLLASVLVSVSVSLARACLAVLFLPGVFLAVEGVAGGPSSSLALRPTFVALLFLPRGVFGTGGGGI